MHKLTVESLDANLLVRLQSDVIRLLASYEKIASDKATKRSAALAINTVSTTR